MIKFIFRCLLVAVIVAGGFHAMKLFMSYRFAVQSTECLSSADQLAMKNERITEVERLHISARTLVCVANKQNFADRMFFDVRSFFKSPEKWPFPLDEYLRQLKK